MQFCLDFCRLGDMRFMVLSPGEATDRFTYASITASVAANWVHVI